MRYWQEGVYNSSYILGQENLIGQIKYENIKGPARLDEISLERYSKGQYCILFTIHDDATNDRKQGGKHARLAHNSLFRDIQDLNSKLKYTINSDEVHRVCCEKGQERILQEFLVRLEEYDNSLSEISHILANFLEPQKASMAQLEEEISVLEQRAKLLQRFLPKKKTIATRARRAKLVKNVAQRSKGRASRKSTLPRRRKS